MKLVTCGTLVVGRPIWTCVLLVLAWESLLGRFYIFIIIRTEVEAGSIVEGFNKLMGRLSFLYHLGEKKILAPKNISHLAFKICNGLFPFQSLNTKKNLQNQLIKVKN